MLWYGTTSPFLLPYYHSVAEMVTSTRGATWDTRRGSQPKWTMSENTKHIKINQDLKLETTGFARVALAARFIARVSGPPGRQIIEITVVYPFTRVYCFTVDGPSWHARLDEVTKYLLGGWCEY